MTTEQELHHLIETRRPYSTPLTFKNIGDGYLVDDKWAVRLTVIYGDGRARLCFASDGVIIREKKIKKGSLPIPFNGVSAVALNLRRADDIVYLGEEYKLTFIGPQRYRLQSTEPIKFVPVSPNADLLSLLSRG